MAQAYVPIQTYTLTSTASTIDFTNIPQNYTDLYIVLSGRSSRSAVNDVLYMKFNDSTSGYSSKILEGNGASATSYSGSSSAFTDIFGIPAASSTASTFGSVSIYIPNYTSSNNKSISVDGVGENNATTAYADLYAGLWSNSSAVTKITLYNIISTFTANTTATLYGIGGARASGGTITADARYTYHTFTSTGTFTANEKIKGAEILCIAGGGGGGSGDNANIGAGGGGGGGVAYAWGQTISAGSSYSAIIGAGGSGGTWSSGNGNNGNAGSNSSFASITGIGGGYGATVPVAGGNGGSGGGAGGGLSASGGSSTQTTPSGGVGYGNAGGANTGFTGAGGGGGGAGVAGSVAASNTGGKGGDGTTLFSSWGYATSTGELSGGVYYYAGGGGGAGYSSTGNGAKGLGGATAGANGGSASNATANTGGGGGGASGTSSRSGGTGGSGLVIIRYPN